jgi:hypothetical protein
MKLARARFALGLIVALAGCGPAIPPAGNYATVSGQVTDATTNKGVAGATISVNVVLSATSDANGNFRVTNVPTGPWSYAVQAPSGYLSPAGSDSNAPLAPGETRTLDIALTHS